jgi:hypothetical protein
MARTDGKSRFRTDNIIPWYDALERLVKIADRVAWNFTPIMTRKERRATEFPGEEISFPIRPIKIGWKPWKSHQIQTVLCIAFSANSVYVPKEMGILSKPSVPGLLPGPPSDTYSVSPGSHAFARRIARIINNQPSSLLDTERISTRSPACSCCHCCCWPHTKEDVFVSRQLQLSCLTRPISEKTGHLKSKTPLPR